ncbi:MAG: threonine synthase [Gammaproteobacteria bacterium]|jgi:threonine synthase
MTSATLYSGLVDKYRDRLPILAATKAVSLCEGNTPLIPLDSLLEGAAETSGKGVRLFAKFEGLNPTGSFKDRGMTMAVTRARELGAKAIICASTGNTSAAAAAYAARAGMRCFVLIPDGKIAMGKLAQAMMHGAVVMQIAGNFDDGMRLVKEVTEHSPIELVNSVNPYRLQGQKTIAFEIIEALGDAPDVHCLPVGNAGNISAHWMGYSESCLSNADQSASPGLDASVSGYARHTIATRRPIMAGYQASGAAPFMRGAPVAEPETVATAIRIGNPQSWQLAVSAVRESGGWFDEFDDREILRVQKLLAEQAGVFCEPASAISVAGALADIASGRIAPGSTVVCTVTGHGLKDPDIAIAQSTSKPMSIAAERSQVERAIDTHMAK